MPPSRVIGTALTLLLAAAASAPFVLLLLAIQSQPLVPPSLPLSAAEMTEVERLLLDSAPTSTARVSQQQLQLDRNELNLLLRYGLQVMALTPRWSGEVKLATDKLTVTTSLALDSGGLLQYLNVRGDFTAGDRLPELIALQVGNLVLSDSLQQRVVNRLRDNLLAADSGWQDFAELAQNIRQVSIEPDSLRLGMLWEPSLIDRIVSRSRQLIVPATDRQRIIAYYRKIGEIVATIPADLAAVSLNTLLVPLFHHAHECSLQGKDPIAENRAALQALAVYVNNEDLQQLLGPEYTSGIAAVPFVEVRLQRRQDLAQHLTSIAATTSSAGAGFAELLSTTKEAYDARYRSGFSFSDLTANSVGVTLATFATRDQQSALVMQTRLSAIASEADYMPIVGSNRDGLSEVDFATLYRDRSSRQYAQRVAEIQQLILQRPLFQGLEQH